MSAGTVNQNLTDKVYNWLNSVQQLLYPPHCRLCAARGEGGLDICLECLGDLPWLTPGCSLCALPLARDDESYCGGCLARPPAFDRVVAPLRYTAPVDYLIGALKFRGSLAAGRLLGSLLALHLQHDGEALPQLLIPVPLHRQRLRQRGFNQARELCRPLTASLGIPAAALLARRRDTPAQRELSASARRRNIRGAFTLTGPVPDHVAIVDDVMTTGSTVDEIARLLRSGGAQRIEVWVPARAI